MATVQNNTHSHTTLRTILRGVTTGRMQSVGLMQVPASVRAQSDRPLSCRGEPNL